MESFGKSDAFLRQLSCGGGGEGGWKSRDEGGDDAEMVVSNNNNNNNNKRKRKKRVMVVIDHTARAKQAMMWALTHVANNGDLLTLLHAVPGACAGEEAPRLANALAALCKASRPEVEVEALVIQGPILATVLSQVRKLEASVLVLGQGKPSPFCCLFSSSGEEFVEDCINKADCLTLAVRKQSKGVDGYLVSTRWQKNFWLLA